MCLSSDDLLTGKDLMDIKSTRRKNSLSFDFSNIKKIWGPTEYYEDKNLILVVVRNKSMPYFILYNKQYKTSVAAEFYNFDDDLAFSPHVSPPFFGVNGSEFIKVIRTTEIANFKKKLLENKNLLSADEKRKLENISEISNPVLIFYETKNKW